MPASGTHYLHLLFLFIITTFLKVRAVVHQAKPQAK